MNCTECEKLIDDYINNKLDEPVYDEFINHILSCNDCLEELRVNYSVITALNQMDRGDELSEDYDAELNEKIVRYVMKKKRRQRAYYGMCLFCFIASIIAGVILSILSHKEKNVEYAVEDNNKYISIGFDGVPDHMDPVDTGISKYNADIIDYINKQNLNEQR